MNRRARSRSSGTRRVLWTAIATLVPLFAIAAVSVVYVAGLPEEFTARAIVFFGSRPTPNGGLAGQTSVEAAAAGYVAFLTSPSTLADVAEVIGEDRTSLRDGLDVAQLPTTSTIEIAYTSVDPENAARGANALAETVVRRAVTDPIVYAEILAEAVVPVNPSGPERLVLLVAGGMLGLLVGTASGVALWAWTGGLFRARHARPGFGAEDREPQLYGGRKGS